MKNPIVRFAALYVFNVAVLLLIGMLLRGVTVGFHALWASVILTIAALVVKPMLRSAFRKAASKKERSRTGEKFVQYALVYAVELIIWTGTVWFSGVRASSVLGYLLPPVFLLLGWMIYDQVDDKLQAKAGQVYDRVRGKVSRGQTDAAPEPRSTTVGRAELNDGLTPEQRRMLDELG